MELSSSQMPNLGTLSEENRHRGFPMFTKSREDLKITLLMNDMSNIEQLIEKSSPNCNSFFQFFFSVHKIVLIKKKK